MIRSLFVVASISLPSLSWADVPRVVTDIGPVESLTAMVMDGLGTPDRLIQPGDSAHDMALRPSQARALAAADLVIWIGPDLNPQLERQIETLAGSALSIALAELPQTHLLPFRDTGVFTHDHDDDDHDEHAEADHHDDEHHDEHAEAEHHDDDAHDHGALDPHVWLSPENATLWLTRIAEALAEADPENAQTYRANAEAGIAKLAAAEAEARDALDPLQGRTLAVAHDALQYFEAHFGLTILGAISDADANTPGPARLSDLRDGLSTDKPACLLIEPGTDLRLLDTVNMADVPTVVVDPLGSDLPQGTDLYPALIVTLANRIATCAADLSAD